jgi:hypothetical protein
VGAKDLPERTIGETGLRGVTPSRGASDVGMSQRTIDRLAAWYEDTFYEHRDEPDIEVRLNRELRRRLREEFGVLAEFIEIEAARVLDRVFTKGR